MCTIAGFPVLITLICTYFSPSWVMCFNSPSLSPSSLSNRPDPVIPTKKFPSFGVLWPIICAQTSEFQTIAHITKAHLPSPTIFKIPRNPKQPIDMGNIECPILDMLLEALPIDSVVIHICFYKDRNRQLLPHIWNSVVKTCRSHNLSFWRQTFVQFFRDIAERCRSSTTKVSKRGRIYPFFWRHKPDGQLR